MKPAEAVLKFLHSVGRGTEEAQFYLGLFRSGARESFAAIAVDGSTLQQAADAVALDLRFLNALDLTPVVVLGLHDNGHLRRDAEHLRQLLGGAEVPSALLACGDDFSEIVQAARAGSIPIVPVEGPDQAERYRHFGKMLASLRTRKLIYLQDQGGLRAGGDRISVVNLSRDYDFLVGSPDLSERQRELVLWSRQLIFEMVPHKLLIAVASPLNLLHELFTVKGAGTLLRRGSRIISTGGFAELDTGRLGLLFEASFGRPLSPGFFSTGVSRCYLEDGYRGAALIRDMPLGGYLSKFAVTREAQGEGIGSDLWQCVTADYPTLIWRARPENPIASWYERQCDGLVRGAAWTVYFKGLDSARIPDAIGYALAQPVDF